MSMSTGIKKGLIAVAAIIPLAMGLAVGQVHGASFDCAKAKRVMEKTICADPTLSKLDDEMAAAYAKAKAELKDRPKELKKLVNSQREWLTLLNPQNSPCAARTECLTNSYQTRIKELQYASAFARATSPTAVGPTQEVVMQRLNEQLEQLKSLVRSAKKVDIGEELKFNKSTVCEEVWKKLPQATVPVPTEFANTAQQKRDLFEKVRQMAYDNQKLFFQQGNSVKNMEKYKKRFQLLWDKNVNRTEFVDNLRRDTVYLLFDRLDSSTGYKRPIAVKLLLDLADAGITLSTTVLGADGLDNGTSGSAYSIEYFNANLMELNSAMPFSEYVGIIYIDNSIMSWKLDELGNNEKLLIIMPIHATQNNQDTYCNISFY